MSSAKPTQGLPGRASSEGTQGGPSTPNKSPLSFHIHVETPITGTVNLIGSTISLPFVASNQGSSSVNLSSSFGGGTPSGPSASLRTDTSTAKISAMSFQVPRLSEVTREGFSVVNGGLKDLNDRTDGAVTSVVAIASNPGSSSVDASVQDFKDLKGHADGPLESGDASAPKKSGLSFHPPVIDPIDGAPNFVHGNVETGRKDLRDHASSAFTNAHQLPGIPGIPGIPGPGEGINAVGGTLGGLLGGLAPGAAGGVFGDIAKKSLLQFLLVIPGRIVAILEKWSWTLDTPKLVKMFFEPSFDLREALLAYSSIGVKLTWLVVVLSCVGGWALLFLILINAAVFVGVVALFWGALSLLGFEVVGTELLRKTRKK